MSGLGTELFLVGGYGTALGNAGTLFGRSGYIPEYSLPKRPKAPQQGGLNIPVLVISAVIFITIVAWFNVISRIYEDTFVSANEQENTYRSTLYALGYAILITGVSFIIGMVTSNFMTS